MPMHKTPYEENKGVYLHADKIWRLGGSFSGCFRLSGNFSGATLPKYLKKSKDELFFVFRHQLVMGFNLKLSAPQTWGAHEVFCKWQPARILGFHLTVAYEKDLSQNLQANRTPNYFIVFFFSIYYHFLKFRTFHIRRILCFLAQN